MKKSLSKATLAKLLLVLVTVAWGSSFVILKDTVSNLGNGNFTFFVLALRFILSGAVLVAVFWKKFIAIKKTTFLKGLILGFILFFAYGIQTVGLKFTTPSKNAFLTSVYCVLVPFLSWLILKNKPKIRHVVAGVLAIVGIAMVALVGHSNQGEHGSMELLGDGLTIISGLFYALQIIYIEKGNREEDAMQLLIVEVLTVAVVCTVVSGLFEFPTHYGEFSFSFEAGWKIVYLALVCTCFAQFGQMVAQKYAPPTSVALIFSLEAVFGVIFELLLGEARLTPYIIIGFIVIFVSQIVSEIGFKRIISIFKPKGNSLESDKEKEE